MVDWCDGRVAELSHWEGTGQSEEFAMIGRHVFPCVDCKSEERPIAAFVI